MKKILGVLLIPLLLLSALAVYAQEENMTEPVVIVEEPFVPSEETVNLDGDPGITPDSPLWGIDVALDKIRLALASGPEKTKLGLKISEERLLELRAMAEAGNLDAADKAEKEHDKQLESLRNELESSNGNISDSDIAEIGDKIDRHMSALLKLKSRIAQNPKLSDEVKAKLLAKFGDSDSSVKEFKANIENKKTKLEIKHRAEGLKEELKVKVKGRLSSEQKKMLRELVNSIDSSGQKTEIKIDCEIEEDKSDCEQVVSGSLTEDQQVLFDKLVTSVEENKSPIKIKVEYKFKREDKEDNEKESEREDEDGNKTETEVENEDENKTEVEDETETEVENGVEDETETEVENERGGNVSGISSVKNEEDKSGETGKNEEDKSDDSEDDESDSENNLNTNASSN